MGKYNKLWIAIGLGGLFVGLKYFEVVPAGFDEVVVKSAESAITAFGVYLVANSDA